MRVGILGIKQIPATMGADRVVEALLERLPPEHEYFVYVTKGRGRQAGLPRNVHLREIPAGRGKHAAAALYFAFSCLDAAVRGRFDLIHLHNSDIGAFCWPLRLRRNVRVIGTFHGDPYRRDKWGRLAKAFLLLSESCFVRVSDALTSVTSTKTVPGREVRYIPNGITPWVSAADIRALARVHVGVDDMPYVIFACGRLDPTKGLHHLLQAYAAQPDAPSLIAIGDMNHDRSYSQHIEQLAARDGRVLLYDGLLPRNELLELIAGARLFVFPSEHEGMAMVLLEAISTGVPVLCSDIPENLAVVGVSYPLVFRSADTASLAQALGAALAASNTDEATSLKSKVLSRFTWGRAADAYAEVYESLRPHPETAGRPRTG